ncbi:MAG: A24 family peptidase [Faecalimonas sp.]|nr:A24 family peptidase [Faecalimonas sp.]
MCEIADVIMIFGLTVISYQDWRTRQISSFLLGLLTVLALVLRCVVIGGPLWSVAGGLGIGFGLLLISKWTGEAIGYGDSWLILSIGIYLGMKSLLVVLFLASFMVAGFSLLLAIGKRFDRRKAFPFAPFLTLAFVLEVFL